ncbi:MAG: CaiB/BaiF CoA transferase family protein [Egibacteraceae bacterium]
MEDDPTQPLRDIRVVEFGQFLAGPYTALLLSELGADVIKVERPGTGDAYRLAGPPFVGDVSVPFITANRGKRSLTLDLSHSDSRMIVERLVGVGDVVVVGSRPSAAARLHLDYESVRRLRADVIYCSVSGYGLVGANADRGALDLVIQAASGLMSVTGEPGGEPLRMGVPITDYGTGMYAALAIVTALRERDRSGKGALIDASLFSTATSWGAIPLLHVQVAGENQPRTGNVHPHIAPYQVLATRDGSIALSAPNEPAWRRLCRAIDVEHLVDDARFSTNAARMDNVTALVAELERTFAQRTSAEWAVALTESQIACAPVHDYGELLDDPGWREQLGLQQIAQDGTNIDVPGFPVRWDGIVPPAPQGAPALGQHTGEILHELGLTERDIERLRTNHVVCRAGDATTDGQGD